MGWTDAGVPDSRMLDRLVGGGHAEERILLGSGDALTGRAATSLLQQGGGRGCGVGVVAGRLLRKLHPAGGACPSKGALSRQIDQQQTKEKNAHSAHGCPFSTSRRHSIDCRRISQVPGEVSIMIGKVGMK